MATGARTLLDAFPGRFLLGLGVSHREQVDTRGHTYAKPVAHMRQYLADIDSAPYLPEPELPRIPRVLAALRRPMIELARDSADGAHPYLVTPEHTAMARDVLGAGALLCPAQGVLMCEDADEARSRIRAAIGWYFGLGNYPPSLRAQGFTDDELAGNGSDRLIDRLIAWGGVDAMAARVRAHLDAGADHVAINALPTVDGDILGMSTIRALAPALLD